MRIEPVFDTSSIAPPPATPVRLFIQEPGVKKKTNKQAITGFLVSRETVMLRRWEDETKNWFYQTS